MKKTTVSKTMKRGNKILLLMTLSFTLLLISSIQASEIISMQEPGLTGYVMDMYTGEPLAGVTVMLKETNTLTRSQEDGSYSLELKEGAKTLIFSYSGYQTLQIDIDGRTEIEVAMSQATSSEEDDELWGL